MGNLRLKLRYCISQKCSPRTPSLYFLVIQQEGWKSVCSKSVITGHLHISLFPQRSSSRPVTSALAQPPGTFGTGSASAQHPDYVLLLLSPPPPVQPSSPGSIAPWGSGQLHVCDNPKPPPKHSGPAPASPSTQESPAQPHSTPSPGPSLFSGWTTYKAPQLPPSHKPQLADY